MAKLILNQLIEVKGLELMEKKLSLKGIKKAGFPPYENYTKKQQYKVKRRIFNFLYNGPFSKPYRKRRHLPPKCYWFYAFEKSYSIYSRDKMQCRFKDNLFLWKLKKH